ncbi:HAD family hydrolase [Paenibacillus prosopidis]|uniref:2-haloacid dehalogenase/putative hydrolase of the HAD superfamily n=1 Tax=Paenibacillus prosopidis TaxID=630520 RepID=A0A368W4K3_9BACL|nr:HAD family hydrolase [Paenibacillus prosopidis]RCW50361.1 2-haloacid dehalogenase/putative hydrolase of the HAD superfamily [Paenibacillus prosopidis]
MEFNAIFLDFYGTLVHEDDDIIPIICEKVKSTAAQECALKDIGAFWWNEFSIMFKNSCGESFRTQRTLGIESLANTIRKFESNCDAEEIIQLQLEHWTKPKLYSDTKPFLQAFEGIPVYILSNIDSSYIQAAIKYHDIHVNDILTSEDVRSYKPRPELFLEALKRYRLNTDEVIHIGDSLISDVGGAQNVGIQAIWLNRLNKSNTRRN